jgi:hypothetical protein
MEIGAANAYVGGCDLHGVEMKGRASGREVAYPDLSCSAFLLIHCFNADIFFAVISCCSHDVGVFVPPVLALDCVGLLLSRLMIVVTNALSMADILTL